MFMFQYIRKLVQFNIKSLALPDVGDFQLLFGFHPRYVHLV